MSYALLREIPRFARNDGAVEEKRDFDNKSDKMLQP
jgi:hypothetical protein